MASLPREREKQIKSFLESDSRKRGVARTQREIRERLGFASLNSVRSHLRLTEKKGMLHRLPGKARRLELRKSPAMGIPLVRRISAGHPLLAREAESEIVPVSPHLFAGSGLFALRVKGDSMKDGGILAGDIAVMARQSDGAEGEIAAVLLDDEGRLKHVWRYSGEVVLRGANAAFPDIVIRNGELGLVQILGKYVGLLRPRGTSG